MANFIKFLGTAGARVVVSKQLRASGGIWVSLDNTNLYIDPGPGALVHCLKSRPPLDPAILDGILLSHRHLDHSGDINVMIEAMTEGTFKKRGIVLAPADALDEDPVILKYLRAYPEKIEKIKVKKRYNIKNLTVVSPIKHQHHKAETYGFIVRSKGKSIAYIADTKYSKEIIKHYKADILIINVLFPEPFSGIEHLSMTDAKEIIKTLKPKTAILTHFGKRVLAAKPWKVAEQFSKELKTKVIAANDGLMYHIQ